MAPLLALAGLFATMAIASVSHAATINWKGHTWNVTAGGMAGVCQGNASNISVDSDGYLHMKITKNGTTWTAAEIFTTDKLGFGTYQWQIDGPVDRLDKNVVVGLYPYGPEAGIGSDGQNEIDIEYARWGNASYPNGNYTVYPATGTGSSEITFDFTLTDTYTTSRFIWSSTKIDFFAMRGFEPVGSTTGLIKAWTFAPSNPTTKVPQQALPLGMNLWCYQNPPSDGQNVEIIVRDFTFIPLGAAIDGGAGDTGATPDASGKVDAGGLDGAAVDSGAAGASGSGGSRGTGGRSGSGGPGGTGDAGGAGSATAGGAAGTIANGGSAAAGRPTGGGIATTGPVGTAGTSGYGGANANGGTVVTGGSAGAGGGLAGAGGSAGAQAPTGSTAPPGTGGAAGASATHSHARDSGGCSCSVAATRGAISGPMVIIVVGLLLNRFRRGTRNRTVPR
jgi:hypothetical protein